MSLAKTETRSATQPRKWRSLLFIAPLRALGWLAWCWIALASFLHGTDFGRRELEGILGRRLEALGSVVQLHGAQVDWLGPGISLQGLTVTEDGREHLYLNKLYISAHYSWDQGLLLDSVDIDGGRLLVSDSGIDDLRALTDGRDALEPGGKLYLPAVEVRGLEVSFEVPDGQVAPLGTFELSMKGQRKGYSKVLGHVLLPKSQDGAARPELFLSGLVSDSGHLQLNSTVNEFELSNWELSPLAVLATLPAEVPRGKLSVFTRGSLNLVGKLNPEGEIRARLADGSLRVPGTPAALEPLNADVSALFEPGPGEDIWTAAAWRGSASLRASWEGQELQGGARLGQAAGPGRVLAGWIQAPNFHVNTPALEGMQSPEVLPIVFSSLAPRGNANIRLAVGLLEQDATSDWAARIEVLGALTSVGKMQAAYHGWPDESRPGVKPMSFAMPVEVDHADLLLDYTPRHLRRMLLDVRFRGTHPTGPARGSYQSWSNPIDMPPFARGYGHMEADLFVEAADIHLGPELDARLEELWELPELAQVFEDYGIEGGRADAQFKLSARADLPTPAVQVDVGFKDARATYAALPVPATQVAGNVRVVDGGRGKSCTSFAARARTATSGLVQIAGRVRAEAKNAEQVPHPTRFQWIRAVLDDVELPGTDLAHLGKTLPELKELIDSYRLLGRAQVEYTHTQRGLQDGKSWLEIAPRGDSFVVVPDIFPMRSEHVRGRVLVELEEPAPLQPGEPSPGPIRSTTRVAPLVALWNEEVPITFHGEFPSEADSWGTLLGAGFPTENTALIGQVLVAAKKESKEALKDLEGIELSGRVDFDYHFVLPFVAGLEADSDEEREVPQSYNLRVRDVGVRHSDGLAVNELRGELMFSEGRLSAEAFTARIGPTPIRLNNLEFVEAQNARDGFTISADMDESMVALNPALFQQFLGEESAGSLFDEFALRGTMLVHQARVAVKIPQDAPIALAVSGQGTLSNASVTVGLPFSVQSARVTIEQFTVVGEDIRGWGRVQNLYGQAIGRDVAQTDFLFSFHGTQVTIQSLDSLFCRGTVRGLGSEDARAVPAPVLSVDLQPPYRFQAGLELNDVDVRLLLEDVFSSGIADRGLLNAHFRLDGDLEHLLDIRGSGSGQVSETVLWSVPVLRELLSQLGMNETAIFDAMGTDFRIADGKIFMKGMSMHSPILKLRGEGILGFDGTLHHDLEVHYSLVDKAGLFGDLIHWLQSSLIAIAIRGDMSRPQVLLSGVFSNPFTNLADNWRGLPSPSYRPLPDRF